MEAKDNANRVRAILSDFYGSPFRPTSQVLREQLISEIDGVISEACRTEKAAGLAQGRKEVVKWVESNIAMGRHESGCCWCRDNGIIRPSPTCIACQWQAFKKSISPTYLAKIFNSRRLQPGG